MDSSQFLLMKNLRKQQADEIMIDLDDRTEHGAACLSAVAILLYKAGYWFSIWYAEGMKQPHIRINKIFNLKDMTKEQVIRYKKAFLKKYIPKEFWQDNIEKDVRGEIPDWSLCNSYEDAYHPVPLETEPHHKYKTPYIKVKELNPEKLFYNFTEGDLYNEAVPLNNKIKKKFSRINKKPLEEGGNFLYQKIAARISIFAIADAYGLYPLGKKLRECPFHGDKNPSLSLNNEKGIFNCFGCHESGNIIKFYGMLKELRPDFKYGGELR